MDDKPDEEAEEPHREEEMVNSLIENAPVVKNGENTTSKNTEAATICVRKQSQTRKVVRRKRDASRG